VSQQPALACLGECRRSIFGRDEEQYLAIPAIDIPEVGVRTAFSSPDSDQIPQRSEMVVMGHERTPTQAMARNFSPGLNGSLRRLVVFLSA
jgi:hypothetical protein